jgi:hypothetical protein
MATQERGDTMKVKRSEARSNAEHAQACADEAMRLLHEAEHGSGEAYRALSARAAGYATLAVYYRDLAE